MLLLPFIRELWLPLLGLGVAWLVVPAILVRFANYNVAIGVAVWWSLIFAVISYFAFDYSAKPYHSNRDAGLAASFAFVMAAIASLSSASGAVLIAIAATNFRRAAKWSPSTGNPE
jgi:hypothetical protein